MSMTAYLRRSVKLWILPFILLACSNISVAQFSVTTYHYDNGRTGWNSDELILTPANVTSTTFGLLKTVVLDDQVDGQPLLIPSVKITAGQKQGIHAVVYLATEANTIYAIGAVNGNVLLKVNFGPPVPKPLGCGNNGPNVGINSTPVIDAASSTMYVIIYRQTASGPAYYIHALDLGSLTDKVTPRKITGSHTLTDGSTYTFNASVQRQRPGLLLANGNVYAGFGSFCDSAESLSRGWLLGWQAGTLTPLGTNQLLDTQATAPRESFLSSIWMSGYALAADYAGSILFVTGNSDSSGTTYDGITDIQESAVKISSDLSAVLDLFTPADQPSLDAGDYDFGAGGILLLPAQPGSIAHIAVAAGKDGKMYMMNEDSLGGHSSTRNHVLGTYQIGGCYCGQSYFQDPADGMGRVVSSGGDTVHVWKLATSPSPSLSLATSSPVLVSGPQDPGFFTTVSSNGTSSAIIWALSRPTPETNSPIYLYAFDPESGGATMKQLFMAAAGAWPNLGGNSNQVPVVANGRVYVASNKQLRIFGLK
jgi:hypothetical protein